MRVAFFGTPDFAVPTLESLLESNHEIVLVVAQPDRPSGRGMKMHRPPVAQLAVERSIPLEQPTRLGDDLVARLQALNTDISVVVAYGRILSRRVIDAVPHGFINVHASLLPRWRGAAPVQRAIEAGERETGVTIMRIDEQLDHGPLFAARTIAIGPDDLAPQVFARLAEAGGSLLVDVLDSIEAGTAIESEQDHARATHARKLEKEEGRIDWSQPAGAIYDRYRAFYPWPGVFFGWGDESLRVSRISGVGAERGNPGEVLALHDGRVVIAAGEGAVYIDELQRPGRRASEAEGVLRGLRIEQGDRLR